MKNNAIEERLDSEVEIIAIGTVEYSNREKIEADILTYEEASIQLGEIYNNFLSKTIVLLIPILSNGQASQNRRIEAPLLTPYLGIQGTRKDIFNGLYSSIRGYVTFQPLVINIENGTTSVSMANYYKKNEIEYKTFFWNDAEKIKDYARDLYYEYSAEMQIVDGQLANGILSERLKELKDAFAKKLTEIKITFLYDEEMLLPIPTKNSIDS